MSKDEALELALEALEVYWGKAEHRRTKEDESKAVEAITAIKEALAKDEKGLFIDLIAQHEGLAEELAQDEQSSSQEPVAWEQFYPDIGKPQLGQEPSITKTGCGVLTLHSGFDDLPDGTKFYTTPPKRLWAGLTEQEVVDLCDGRLTTWEQVRIARATEDRLKELNT